MMEILQAEIVAYSSPTEIFVNGPDGDSCVHHWRSQNANRLTPGGKGELAVGRGF